LYRLFYGLSTSKGLSDFQELTDGDSIEQSETLMIQLLRQSAQKIHAKIDNKYSNVANFLFFQKDINNPLQLLKLQTRRTYQMVGISDKPSSLIQTDTDSSLNENFSTRDKVIIYNHIGVLKIPF
jgi:hypothetical protein